MAFIVRCPGTASQGRYDLAILGGGIYGAMLALESSLRGLRPILLESQDFGGATSFNSLRILHGGLRYLQKLDFRRFRESVAERKWFLRSFPDHVQILPCLMPLYGEGLRRPGVFRTASYLNDWLSRERNLGIRDDRRLPACRVVDAAEARRVFPGVDTKGLQGGAVWYDACMPDSQRILMEILRCSCAFGGVALNYVEALELLKSGSQVAGVLGRDVISGDEFEFRASVVVNACGPWCREVGERFDRDHPELFHSSLAWNVLFDREPPSDHALAVKPWRAGARTYFLVPWKRKLMAGTGHAPWYGLRDRPKPSPERLDAFIDDLNRAIPELHLTEGDVLHVFTGLLPAARAGTETLANREVIVDHGANGGPKALFSVSGVKFTTARLVAEKTLKRAFGESHSSAPLKRQCSDVEDHAKECCRGPAGLDGASSSQVSNWERSIRRLVDEEAVQHLDDLLFRRTALWSDWSEIPATVRRLCGLFGWSEAKCRSEIARVMALCHNPPGGFRISGKGQDPAVDEMI